MQRHAGRIIVDEFNASVSNTALLAANPLTIGLDMFECVDCGDGFLGEVAAVPGAETSRRSLFSF
jgi:hypothetical protein